MGCRPVSRATISERKLAVVLTDFRKVTAVIRRRIASGGRAIGGAARLIDDLGEEELTRCIDYIDESAQMHGNKNKWRDWNLVIRKCSRERWGIRGGNGSRPSASGSAMDDLQQLHQMYASEESL